MVSAERHLQNTELSDMAIAVVPPSMLFMKQNAHQTSLETKHTDRLLVLLIKERLAARRKNCGQRNNPVGLIMSVTYTFRAFLYHAEKSGEF